MKGREIRQYHLNSIQKRKPQVDLGSVPENLNHIESVVVVVIAAVGDNFCQTRLIVDVHP